MPIFPSPALAERARSNQIPVNPIHRFESKSVLPIQSPKTARSVIPCIAAICLAVAIAGCAGPKRAKGPAPAAAPSAGAVPWEGGAPAADSATGEAPAAGQAGPPPHIVFCREYADQTAGRELQREFDSMSGNFRGGDSPLFQEFARMDAVKYRRQLYESCLSNQRAREDRIK